MKLEINGELGAPILSLKRLFVVIFLNSASPGTLYPNKKQHVARSYGDEEF